jgi:hypothetical protein
MKTQLTILICFLLILFVKSHNSLQFELKQTNGSQTNITRSFPAPWFGTSVYSISIYFVFAIASIIIMVVIMVLSFVVVKITDIRPKPENKKFSVVTGNTESDYSSVPSNEVDAREPGSDYSVLPGQ